MEHCGSKPFLRFNRIITNIDPSSDIVSLGKDRYFSPYETLLINDIEDNYPEYLTETLGYQWKAWDILTQAQVFAHDQILVKGSENDDLNAIELWALCRWYLNNGDMEHFLKHSQVLLTKNESEEILDFSEIAAFVSQMLFQEGDLDGAKALLDIWTKKNPDHVDLKGSVFLIENDITQELDSITDPEFLFDLVELLWNYSQKEKAKLVFEKCERLVGDNKLSAIYVDLDSMRRKLKS